MKIDTTSGDFDYTYLSLGAGVQSSALLVLACQGKVPKPDVAIFADTGDEPPWVYEYVELLGDYAKAFGIEVITAQRGVLSDWVHRPEVEGGRFASVPIFTLNEDGTRGMLRRQCTLDFKVQPLVRKVRELLGYDPRQRVRHRVRAMIGITIDEAQRMKPCPNKWQTNTWPLVDLGLRREDCFEVIEAVGLPKPQKSACVYCPYHSDAYWQWMKDEQPGEFHRAVRFDEAIRDLTARGVERPGFVHGSLVPLAEAVFNTTDPNQVDMFNNECEGLCGV